MLYKPFAVLDRDGTLIVERNYLSKPEEVELIPGTVEGLRDLIKLGFGLVVITNQSGIGRGYFDEAQLARINRRLNNLLAREGIILAGIYYCPHTPENRCRCRKPQTGLLERAATQLEFDPRRSFVIGDKACDIDLGRNAGATTILVQTGYGSRPAIQKLTSPDYVARNVQDAARIIAGLLTANVSNGKQASFPAGCG
jgi:histidinol-phosphate phosphatase family protein